MKPMTGLIAMLATVLTTAPVMAAETTKVYKSGVLVLGFLGFLALIVVLQLIPSVLMALGMARGLLKRRVTPPAEVAIAKDEA